MSAEGSQSLAAPRGRPSHLLVPARTKTALALLYDEGLENAYDVRLKLTKEVLTIQKQDVVCIGGAPPGANVCASRLLPRVPTLTPLDDEW